MSVEFKVITEVCPELTKAECEAVRDHLTILIKGPVSYTHLTLPTTPYV